MRELWRSVTDSKGIHYTICGNRKGGDTYIIRRRDVESKKVSTHAVYKNANSADMAEIQHECENLQRAFRGRYYFWIE